MHFHSQKTLLTRSVKVYRKRFIQILLLLAIAAVGLIGSWFILKAMLNTECPASPVSSGDMCVVQHFCDGWSRPFAPTLHIGDLIIVRGIDPKEIRANPYPNGDIIVFHRPTIGSSGDLIIHRAVGVEKTGDTIYFITQGDGVAGPDAWKVPENLVVGKVVLRIPWVGHIAFFIHNFSGIFIIIILIVILVIVEFVIPAFIRKKPKVESKEDAEKLKEDKAL